MDLDVIENGVKIGILSDASVSIENGEANVIGRWMGVLPFASASDQTAPFELRGLNTLITNAWISGGIGEELNQSIKLTGILKD